MEPIEPNGVSASSSESAARSRPRFVGEVHSVREMVAKARSQPFARWDTLVEAMDDPDGAVILAGDYGGQVYLTVPASLVECSEETLRVLLSDLDAMRMMTPAFMELHYERHPIGSGVAGGTGGGIVVDGVWAHPNLPADIRLQAEEVVLGERNRMSLALVREERRLRIASVQERLDRPENREWLEARGRPTTYVAAPPEYPIDEE